MNREEIFARLRCPVCGSAVRCEGKSLYCSGARPHCYDLAKSGYVNLALQHANGGDAPLAVQARNAFLGAGYYRPAADAITDALRKYLPGGFVIDAGCGEGYYSLLIAEAGYELLGIDLSRAAVDTAAKGAKRSGIPAVFAVASVFEIPVADASADAIVNIFAPCAEPEFCRVLRPGGYLVLAGAGREHLLGLKQALYSETYENPGRSDLPSTMRHVETLHATFDIAVEGNAMIGNLFSMTPYYWRTSQEDAAKLATLETLTTRIDFEIGVYQKEN